MRKKLKGMKKSQGQKDFDYKMKLYQYSVRELSFWRDVLEIRKRINELYSSEDDGRIAYYESKIKEIEDKYPSLKKD